MYRVADGRSFIKWAGGKTRYAAQLVAAAPPFTGCYWEPFMGSAAVFFELRPVKAVLSDANPELVACFRAVANPPWPPRNCSWCWSGSLWKVYRMSKPLMRCARMIASASSSVRDGAIVNGSTTMPDCAFLTRNTSRACCSIVRFL